MSVITGPGVYPLLQNCRSYSKNILESRPGTVLIGTCTPPGGSAGPVHSLKRLNDLIPGASSSWTRIAGSGDRLFFGESAFNLVTASIQPLFSGNPLALVDYRPIQSPESWVYIGDSEKTGKINVVGTFYNMGVAPPLAAPVTVFGPDSFDVIDLFNESVVGGWGVSGTASGLSAHTAAAVGTTVVSIFYDAGTTGWASIYPNSIIPALAAPGMFLVIGTGATQENVLVSAVYPSPTSTTIASISYASGTTGLCTIFPTSGAFVVYTGQIVQLNNGGLNQEYVQVISFNYNAVGAPYFTCATVNNHLATETLSAYGTLRAYTQFNHTVGDPIDAGYFSLTMATGTGILAENVPFDLSQVAQRPQQQTDVVSLWLYTDAPADITTFNVLFDVDSETNNFTVNYYIGTATVTGFPSSGWAQVSIPISGFSRVGTDASRTWANVMAVGIQMISSGAANIRVSSFTIYGQYGPDVGNNGHDYLYRYRYRSAKIVGGPVSLPGPPQRGGSAPSDQSVLVEGMVPSGDPQVDTIDVFRYGGALTNWIYIGSTANMIGATFLDVYQDIDIANNPLMTYDDFRPFPTVDIPRAGTCNVSGYTVTQVSGDVFNVLWAPGSEITVDGIPNTLYNYPTMIVGLHSIAWELELVEPMGILTGVSFQLPQATLDAQTLPCLWGPFLNSLWACGDLYQPGVLFATKGNNPDSAPDTSYIEITTPSEPLMNGCIYGGYNYVCSSERMFAISQDYTGQNIAIYTEIPNAVGLYSRWGLCVGKNGMYGIWRTGIWRSEGGAQKFITDPDLTLLFPHDGQPGQSVTLGSVTFQPPDFSQTSSLRLSWADFHLFFDYIDINGQRTTLVFNEIFQRWGPDIYAFNGADGASIHYAEEAPNLHSSLIGGSDGNVYQQSGTQDNGNNFTAIMRMAQVGGATGFQHVRDGYIGLLTNNPASLVVFADAVDYSQALSSTGGDYERAYTPLQAVKGKTLEWGISSASEWKLWIADTFFRVKGWAADSYQPFQPFSNLKREL